MDDHAEFVKFAFNTHPKLGNKDQLLKQITHVSKQKLTHI